MYVGVHTHKECQKVSLQRAQTTRLPCPAYRLLLWSRHFRGFEHKKWQLVPKLSEYWLESAVERRQTVPAQHHTCPQVHSSAQCIRTNIGCTQTHSKQAREASPIRKITCSLISIQSRYEGRPSLFFPNRPLLSSSFPASLCSKAKPNNDQRMSWPHTGRPRAPSGVNDCSIAVHALPRRRQRRARGQRDG